MQERIRHANEHFIVEYIESISIISETDVNGKITSVNKLFETISGYSAEELIGKNHNIVNSGYHTSEFFQEMWKTIKSKKVWRGDILNKKKNGEMYLVDSIIIPRFDEKNEITGYMSIRFDITERVRLKEEEIAQYRLRALGESTAQILHDIRNPLMLIDNTLKLVQQKVERNTPCEKDDLINKIEKMKKSSLRISEICRNMQMLMHGTTDQKLVNMSDEIESSQLFLAEKFERKNVKFNILVNGKKEALSFRGNSVQFQQVLINLINNSIDAIENMPDPWIKVIIEESGEMLCLSVIDCGKGIDPSIQSKIWNSMFTTKDLYKGTGLGLGICKKIIESFKGKIQINNNCPNTRFDVYLPKVS